MLHRLAAVISVFLSACSSAPAPKPATPATPRERAVQSEAPKPKNCREPEVESAVQAAAQPAEPAGEAGPSADRRREIFDAVLAAFPEGYRDLAKLSFEHVSERFAPSEVRFLAPAAKMKDLGPEELKQRACAAKKELGWDCACEEVKVGAPKDYAWSEWPDRRVVPVTVMFFLGC